mmetsp:Transcript_13143/g.37311  ORF Transcript_13143/g.37311 Transcript_13143/m.37311 type:complete len:114 (-) Transcript_13143:1024-1365(-)
MSLHDAYWHVKNKRYAVSPNEVCGIRLLFFAEGRRQKPRLTVAGGQGFMMHLAAYECSLHADEQDFVPSIDPNRYRGRRFEEEFFPSHMVELLWEQNVDEEMERTLEEDSGDA